VPLTSIDATAISYNLYDMRISEVLDLKRYIPITNQAIYNGTLKLVTMYAPAHYNFAVEEMAKHFGVSKRNTLAALETLGLSILQHRYIRDIKRMSDIRTRLFKTDSPVAV